MEEFKRANSRIESLKKQLDNNKIFLNMVIHDMRNPCNSVEYGLKETLRIIEQLFKIFPKDSPEHDFSSFENSDEESVHIKQKDSIFKNYRFQEGL